MERMAAVDTNSAETLDLRGLLAVLRARKWTILVAIALVTGSVLAFSFVQTPLYTSDVRVFVEALPDDPQSFNPLIPVDLNTQAEIVASEAVAALVQEQAPTNPSVPTLLEHLSVVPEGETQILRISYTSPNPRLAQENAQAFATQYLRIRRQRSLEDISRAQKAVESRIQSTSEQLTRVTADLAEAEQRGNVALLSSYETQRSTLIARLGVLQQQLDDIQSQRADSSDTGEIIEPAAVPRFPSSPRHARNGILGLLLGSALGVGLAFLRERLDDRFKERADVERALESPVLATVPRYPASKKGQPALVSLSNASVAAAESYRSLRTNLQFITAQRGIKSVLITSPSESEGKTSTLANLGTLLAQTGRRVILVSSDLRRPALGRYFDVAEDTDLVGLSNWLAAEKTNPADIILDPGIPNMRLIPSGPLPPNPAELLNSRRLAELVTILEENADVVLFDSPPILAVADAGEIAPLLGGTVLVVNAESTHRSAAIHARTELERTGGTLLGSVFNAFDPSSSAYYTSSSYGYYEAAAASAVNGGTKVGDKPKKRRFLSRP